MNKKAFIMGVVVSLANITMGILIEKQRMRSILGNEEYLKNVDGTTTRMNYDEWIKFMKNKKKEQ